MRTEAKRAYHRRYMREWRKTHPLTKEQRFKDNCRSYARVYMLRGLLEKQPCEVCGDENSEMHHDDYDFPLAVRWLCRKHHMELHLNDCSTRNIKKEYLPEKMEQDIKAKARKKGFKPGGERYNEYVYSAMRKGDKCAKST